MTLMATKPHTAGNKIRYKADYSNWLMDGDTLSPVANACTVALLPAVAPAVTVTDVTVTMSQVLADHLWFFVQGGSVPETFVVQVSITTTRGEIDNDTIAFTVVAP